MIRPTVFTRTPASRDPGDEHRRYDVVVSYNRAEGRSVERIARRLQNEGLRVFLDRWSMTVGRLWQDEIVQAIQASAACAVFIGPEGLGDWAREELAVAQSRAAKDPRFRLFMVLMAGAPSPLDPALAFLSTRSWVDLGADGGEGSAFERLVTAITGIPRHPEAPPASDAMPCPYRGLEPFDERHADLFFGRQDDTQRLCERLHAARFVAVLGPSGSGKSSIVKAGLIPALRRDGLAHSADWTIRTMTPGASPLAGLAAQVAHVAAGESMQLTLAGLAADERSLDLSVALALADRPAGERLVLVVDQLEEVFTLCGDERERTAFLGNLAYAATIPGGRTVVVVTLRADFYHRCAPYPAFRNLLAAQQMMIGPLGDEGLRRAIEEPAWATGLTLEPGLVDTIVADVGDRAGTLPLLQHVLVQVWQRRRGPLLTVEAYRASGGVQGALAKHADAVYDHLAEHQRDLAERVLLRLVQPGEGTEDARRRIDVDELLTADDDAEVETVLRRLADERLLTTSRDETSGARLVEITHEALLQGWPRLRRWIERDREALLAHRRLTEASREWERTGRDDAMLYRGPRLAAWRPSADRGMRPRRARLTETVEWRARRNRALNQLEREFLDASDAREQRERAARRMRVRVAFAGLLVTLAVITIVAAVAVHEAKEAKRQRDMAVSGDLTARSISNLSQGNVDVAALLGLEAYRARPTIDARNAVLSVLPRLERSAGALRGHTDEINAVAFSPGRKMLATASADRSVRLWNAVTHRPIGSPLIGHTEAVNSVAFSPDGATLATAGWDNQVLLWSVARHRIIARLTGHRGGVFGLAFTPDAKFLLSAGGDGTVRLWNIKTRQAERPPLRDGRGPIYALTLSRDGRALAAGGKDGSVRLWDLKGHQVRRLIAARPSELNALAFSPDGQTLASVARDGAVRLWKVKRRRAAGTPLTDAAASVDAVQFSPDGRVLALGGKDDAVQLWSVAKRRKLGPLLRLHTGDVFGVAFDPTGRTLASASADRTVRLWHVTPRHPLAVTLRGHRGPVFGVAFSPDRRTVASGGIDQRVRFWHIGDRRQVGKISTGQAGGVLNVAFSPDGRTLASAGSDKTVRLWDVATRRARAVFPGHAVWNVALSSNGRTLASAGADGTVRLFDARTRQTIGSLEGHTGRVADVEFSPDGRTLASAGVDDNTVALWDLRMRSRRPTVLRGHTGGVTSVAFSPDGSTLASADARGAVRLHDVAAPTSKGIALSGSAGAMLESLAFNVDGKTVAAVDANGRLRLWDIPTRRALGAPLEAHDGVAYRVAFSPGGGALATVGQDMRVRLWDSVVWSGDIRRLRRRICAEIGFSLSRAEWRGLVSGEPYHKTCR